MILFEHLYVWVVRQATLTNGGEVYDKNVYQQMKKDASTYYLPVVSQPERLRSCLI